METNPSDDTENWFRIVPGANGTSPALVMVSGERSVQGVTVDVDNAAAITLTDKGGRGNVITLADGVNTLSSSSFTNALSIKANDGYQLTEVTYNGDAVQANGQGAYNVTASEGGYIQIRSRRSPVATTVNFAGDPAQFTLRVNGQQVESANSINVRTYDEITVAPAAGYDLLSLAVRESAAADVTKGEGNYTIYLKDAEVNSVNVALTITEKNPSEGNVIVVATAMKTTSSSTRRSTAMPNSATSWLKCLKTILSTRLQKATSYRFISRRALPVTATCASTAKTWSAPGAAFM